MLASHTCCLCVTSYKKRNKQLTCRNFLIDNLWMPLCQFLLLIIMLFSASVVIIYVCIFLKFSIFMPVHIEILDAYSLVMDGLMRFDFHTVLCSGSYSQQSHDCPF